LENLINLITPEEAEMIEFSRDVCIGLMENTVEEKAPLENVLFPWQSLKSSNHLSKLLNGQLIYKFPIDISTNIVEYNLEQDERRDGPISKFLTEYGRCLESFYHDSPETISTLKDLVSFSNLTSGIVDKLYEFKSPFGRSKRTLNIKQGVKLPKAIQKINMFWESEYPYYKSDCLKDFLDCYSVARSNTHIKGNLCLSIHPLDFITMSDNAANWSSCMSWKDDGDYRNGVLEMMDSPYVLIAYVESPDSVFFIGNNKWNNKIWRELFLFDEKFIVNIKDYPFHCNELTKIARDTLIRLANENLGYNFQDEGYIVYEDFVTTEAALKNYLHEGEGITVSSYRMLDIPEAPLKIFGPDCKCMYNDFYTNNTDHYIVFNKSAEYPTDRQLEVLYGEQAICFWCGRHLLDRGHNLSCEECKAIVYCDSCGEALSPSEAIKHNESYFCQECYSELLESETF
jgi:hypothetical protein